MGANTDQPEHADREWARTQYERLRLISVEDALDGIPPFPRLPAHLDDRVALNNWSAAWDAWIADEAVQRQRPWLKPMTPTVLSAIVQAERRLRADLANIEWQEELARAKDGLNAFETRQRAADPQYEAKRKLLVPILQPLFKHLPPSKWVTTFEQAYANAPVAGESRSKTTSNVIRASDIPTADPKNDISAMRGVQQLYNGLPENPALGHHDWRKVIERVRQEFANATTSEEREGLLEEFTTTMDIVESSVEKHKPEMLEEFRNARGQDYKIFIVQECLVGNNMDAKTLLAVTGREIAAGRMASNCTSGSGASRPGQPWMDGVTRQRLNAEVDRQRREALAGRVPKRGHMTLLLYTPSGHPDQIGVSKIDPPEKEGAFFLDFSRPLRITRRYFGITNSWIGRAVDLWVPVVHHGEQKGGYQTFVYRSDPCFKRLRALWKVRFPSAKPVPNVAAAGFKIMRDFAAQFPDSC